jgi:hypothetical protein
VLLRATGTLALRLNDECCVSFSRPLSLSMEDCCLCSSRLLGKVALRVIDVDDFCASFARLRHSRSSSLMRSDDRERARRPAPAPSGAATRAQGLHSSTIQLNLSRADHTSLCRLV